MDTPQKQSSGTRTCLLGLLALFVVIFCVLPIIFICLLALLGPAIGDVFSDIVEELGTPTPGLIMAFLTR